MNEENEVWLLWEGIYSVTGHRNLLGIYDNEAAAQADTIGDPRRKVERWYLLSGPVES